MSKRKLVLAYVCLVGLPLLGLVGIIRAGQHLVPPIAVGGPWNLEADFGSLGSGPCKDLLAGVNQPFFSISQSGTNLMVTLNNSQKTTLPGVLQGATLTVGTGRPEGSDNAAGNCARPEALNLVGTVDKQAAQRVLAGTLTINSCASCTPVAIRAIRQTLSGKGGR